MKKIENVFKKMKSVDPMIWGYVMLGEKLVVKDQH